MFEQPNESGRFFKPADHNGSLILFTKVSAPETRFDSLRGHEIEQVTVDYVDFNDGELQTNCIVTHNGIVNKIKGKSMILGRVTTAETRAGKTAWVLGRFDAADEAVAKEWVNSQPTFASADDESPAISAAAKLLRGQGLVA